MKRGLMIGAGIVVALALAVYALRVPITYRLIDRVAARNLASTLLDELPDGLHVGLCGAGSPLPDPVRSGPCVFVVAGGRLFIVDSGSGSSRVLGQLRVPQGDIEALFLTHLHSDHIDGLGELELQRWANGARSEPLPIYGPEGVQAIVGGINMAYGPSREYRVAHHGPETVPPSGAGAVALPFAQPDEGELLELVNDDGLVISTFRVEHEPVNPAVGYKFEYGGRTAVLSGDTAKSMNLEVMSDGADLLVHEALSRTLVGALNEAAVAAGRDNLAKITADIMDYHASPVEAAETARDAEVGHLLYYHIVPPLPLAPMEDIFLEGVDDVYDGGVTLGRDGTFVLLESGGESIEVRELL